MGALSLRTLAAGEGTPTSAIYSLFGGKDGLLEAVYRDSFRRVGEATRGSARRADARFSAPRRRR
ncbi:TetR family transcriptional regulator [Microbacterium hominis]|uniref:TetR family transcriptional regulator n=1 Tax=Microbacterium hominis TaxID=162426 RepID=A0A7D4Q749_9MICO|nr:TetR family transcriptional regulator [Microbacterium hominis]